jgi:hypothetical protein
MVWDRTPVPDEAAFAPNWWRILAVDLAIGLAIIAAGVLGGLRWSPLAWALVPLGGYYTFFVAKRIVRWRDLRRRGPG